MDTDTDIERVLAFNKASLLEESELENISGGASRSTTQYTSINTIDVNGNHDHYND